MAAKLPCVELTGAIKHADLPDFLRRMDIGLVPSTYPEPFPLVPLEMMAAGVPVIAYDSGGFKEQIVDGVTGFLVENKNPVKLAEKIACLLDNPSQITLMGLAARKHVEQNFTWERHVGQLLDIYGKLTGNTK